MDIYLIRHGEIYNSNIEYYDVNKAAINPPLSKKGILQAEKLAERLKQIKFDVIFSSDLIRAIQTSEKIIEVSPSNLLINSAFREINMGDISLKPWSDFPLIYSEWLLHNSDIAYPNGENGAEVWARCKEQLDMIISNKYEKVAIVCHGGTIRSFICGTLDIPQQKRFYLGMPLENCSISIVKYDKIDKIYYLHTFNDYSHLE